MSKQTVQIETASPDPGEPMPQGELADPESSADNRGALSLLQLRESLHDDLDARHLAGKNVIRKDPLVAIAATANS